MLKAFFILEILTFLSWLIGYVEKRLNREAIVKFKIYDVTDWPINSSNKHIAQYFKR